MKDIKNGILLLPIEKLSLNTDCKDYLIKSGFHTLQEVLEKGWGEMRKMPDFDYIRFNDLIRFLEAEHILYLFEQ